MCVCVRSNVSVNVCRCDANVWCVCAMQVVKRRNASQCSIAGLPLPDDCNHLGPHLIALPHTTPHYPPTRLHTSKPHISDKLKQNKLERLQMHIQFHPSSAEHLNTRGGAERTVTNRDERPVHGRPSAAGRGAHGAVRAAQAAAGRVRGRQAARARSLACK